MESGKEGAAASFKMASFPVTVTQFAQFIAEDGYEQKRFWYRTPAVWQAWQNNKHYHHDKAKGRECPHLWHKTGTWNVSYPLRRVPASAIPDHPVTCLTLAEAWAYAAFYEEKMLGKIQGVIRLPTEQQWLLAVDYMHGRHQDKVKECSDLSLIHI